MPICFNFVPATSPALVNTCPYNKKREMADANESVGWMSGLISNSSATSSSPLGNHHASHASMLEPQNERPHEQISTAPHDEGAGADYFVQQVAQLLKSISLTPRTGATANNVNNAERPPVEGDEQLFPIFFSAVPTNGEGPNRHELSERSAPSSSSFSYVNQISQSREEALKEKIQRMLSSHMAGGDADRRTAQGDADDASSPDTLKTHSAYKGTVRFLDLAHEDGANQRGSGDRNAEGTVTPQTNTNPTGTSTIDTEIEASAEFHSGTSNRGRELDPEESRTKWLEQKCEAQELLIQKLYKDVLAAERKQAKADMVNEDVTQKFAEERAQWERERLEWATECGRLARMLQTRSRHWASSTLKSTDEMLCEEVPKRLAITEAGFPAVPTIGGLGSSSHTFVSMHEELHYTKGYNTALRGEVDRLKAEVAKKDKALVELGAQLREAYRARAGLTDYSFTPSQSRLKPTLFDVGNEPDPPACTVCGEKRLSSRARLDAHEERIIDGLLKLIESRGNARRRSASGAHRRTASPFRNTKV